MNDRRNAIKTNVPEAGSLYRGASADGCSPGGKVHKRVGGSPLQLRFKPYELHLKHVFTLASGSRTTTPVMLVELEIDGTTGFGEASLPPYLGETRESVAAFLSGLELTQFKDPFLTEDILDYVFTSAPGNFAAKAAVDIALHDLTGKLAGQPCHRLWGLNPDDTPVTSFTIGIDTPGVVREKVKEASMFKMLKVKLGRGNDREMIEAVRSVTDVPLCVDVNQGWTDRHMALDMVNWMAGLGVEFVEQPMSIKAIDDTAWLTQNSPLPIVADEALQGPDDVLRLHGVYSGINIKLMKCGGLRAAHKMIMLAKNLGMEVMIGCMTETSCAVSAAAQLSPLVRWADLDGNLLITNDLFDGIKVVEGKITLSERPGVGVVRLP
jgi:L-Ala-D/L-Glu epimerase